MNALTPAGKPALRSAGFPAGVLLALPFALLLIDPSWFYSPLLLDPFIYFGYYQNLPGFLRAFPTEYYGSRLPVLLPGWIAHQALPTLVANAVLRLGIYYTSVFALYFTLSRSHGKHAGFVAAVLLGTSPFFLGAVGWDYADGFGLAYAFTAHWLWTRSLYTYEEPLPQPLPEAGRGANLLSPPRFGEGLGEGFFGLRNQLAAGFALACLVFANLFYVVFAFFIVAEFLLALPMRWKDRGRSLATIAIGFLAATFMFMAISKALGGRFLFFMGSVSSAAGVAEKDPAFLHVNASWLLNAAWLIVPTTILIGGGILVFTAWRRNVLTRVEAVSWFSFACQFFLLLALEPLNLGVVRYWYYPNMLLASGMLTLGRLMARPLAKTEEPLPRPLPEAGRGENPLAPLPASGRGENPLAPLPASGRGWGRGSSGTLPAALLVVCCAALWRLPAQSNAIEWGTWGRFIFPTAIGVIGLAMLSLRPRSLVLLTSGVLLFSVAQGIGKSAFRYECVWPKVPPIEYERIRAAGPMKPEVLQAVVHTHTILKHHDPEAKIRLWYDANEPAGLVYRQVAVAYLFRNTNPNFPAPSPLLVRVGEQDFPIAIFSHDPTAADRAMSVLAPHAQSRIVSQHRVRTDHFDFWVWILHVEPRKSNWPLSHDSEEC